MKSVSPTTAGQHQLRSIAALAASVALAYYVAVRLGLALRFPPATTSVLWPPNAVLTAALLLVPIRLWWVCLLSALPVHFWVQSSVGWPVPMVAALFVTNCSEAIIGAGLLRILSDQPQRFDTLRRVGAFIIAAGIVAPVLSSFADAAIVHSARNEPYWVVWRTRVFANTLTELSVVPPLVLIATRCGAMLEALARRWVEGALLMVVGGGVAVFALGASPTSLEVPGLPQTPTVFLLPVFFWAAIRFGAGGLSGALFEASLIASVAASAGRRAFGVLAPQDGLIAVQMYLILMAVPLLAIGALLDERRRAMVELTARLRFEALLSWMSAAFVRSGSDGISSTLQDCLGRLGPSVSVDRAMITERSASGERFHVVGQWVASGVDPLPDSYACDLFPWVLDRLVDRQMVLCNTIADLPADASIDRSSFLDLGLRGALVIPMVASDAVHGVLSLQMLRTDRSWDQETVGQMRLVAELLATALARKRADDALRSSESMKAAILSSLSHLVAVLDSDGKILVTNPAWLNVDDDPSVLRSRAVVGVNYLDLCRRAAADDDLESHIALDGVSKVLGGQLSSFTREYASPGPNMRWYSMSVVPLQRREGGAVISLLDVSVQKRAEIAVQHARQELAYFSRVATMGELTASLAHQLNQPLTAILTNTEVALRLLDATPPDLLYVREILADVVGDDLRAADVIRRTREMLVKTSRPRSVLDLNGLIRDVAGLMRSDRVIRNVPVTLDLAEGLPRVVGDHVELQQLVLNLLINAMDAVADAPVPDRSVMVRSRSSNGLVVVSVKDSGHGFDPVIEAQMFEPFFTTKATGMGMGLSIARSIAESHGGRVWAENSAPRGAEFFVSLPTAHRARS